ncbi:MAG TPA: hypothetical protein VFT16_05875 [Candidatus Saccharimonadales bacterium]|nr:hypothetical protein [Candidatus Saccharimonadales bacterium]
MINEFSMGYPAPFEGVGPRHLREADDEEQDRLDAVEATSYYESRHAAPDVAEEPQAREALGMKVLKAGVIINEMLPTDDVMRYGLLVASQEYAHNPAVGAAVLGLATLATEGSAVLAASKWIADDRIRPILNTVCEKIDNFKETLNRLVPPLRIGRLVPNLPKDPEEGKKLPITIQAAVALNLGTVVMLEAMQRRDPSRTAEQNRSYGLRTTAMVSGYMAVEGALLSAGYENLASPTHLALAALGVAGLHYGAHKLRQKAQKGEQS